MFQDFALIGSAMTNAVGKWCLIFVAIAISKVVASCLAVRYPGMHYTARRMLLVKWLSCFPNVALSFSQVWCLGANAPIFVKNIPSQFLHFLCAELTIMKEFLRKHNFAQRVN